jgi:hypothetical protein
VKPSEDENKKEQRPNTRKEPQFKYSVEQNNGVTVDQHFPIFFVEIILLSYSLSFPILIVFKQEEFERRKNIS